MNQLIKIEAKELNNIEQSKAEKIKKTFEPMAKMLTDFEDDYKALIEDSKEEITKDITARAKRLRLNIGKVRIETGKLKDKQKEYIKLEDKAIMGVHNILVWAVKEKEDNLKQIEKHFEIQEKNRLEKLQYERAERLSQYLEDAHERDLAKFEDDEFEALLTMKKKEKEDQIAAEKKAEQERIAKEKAEAEERERIRQENERLKKEVEERERLAKIEAEKRAKQEAERIAKEQAELKARQEAERKQREEYQKKLETERKERERIESEERKKREAIEAELKAKKEAEIKAKQDEYDRVQAELNKGDSEKVNDLIKDLKDLKSKYTFKSSKNKKMYQDVSNLIDKVISHIER